VSGVAPPDAFRGVLAKADDRPSLIFRLPCRFAVGEGSSHPRS